MNLAPDYRDLATRAKPPSHFYPWLASFLGRYQKLGMRVDSFKIDVQIITFNYSQFAASYQSRHLPSLKTKIVPRKQKAAPAWCVSLAPGPQHSQRCLSLSGPALQSLSPDQAAGLLALGWAWVSPDCVSVSEVKSVPSPQVLSHNQSSGERTHRDISAAATREHTANSDLVTKPLLSSSINVSVTFNLLGREILASNWE